MRRAGVSEFGGPAARVGTAALDAGIACNERHRSGASPAPGQGRKLGVAGHIPPSGGSSHVREQRREVLRVRRPRSLLECQSGQLGAGPGGVRQGLDRVLPRLPGARAARHALVDRALPEVLRGGLRQGRLRGRLRRRRALQPHGPAPVVHRGLQHDRAQRADGREVSGPAAGQRPLGPARGRGRPREARGGGGALRPQGGQALHGRVAERLARLEADRPGGGAVLREVPGARHQERPRPQGADDLAARQGRLRRRPTSTTWRPTSRSSTSSSST